MKFRVEKYKILHVSRINQLHKYKRKIIQLGRSQEVKWIQAKQESCYCEKVKLESIKQKYKLLDAVRFQKSQELFSQSPVNSSQKEVKEVYKMCFVYRRLEKIDKVNLRDQGDKYSFKICKNIFSVYMAVSRCAEGLFRLDIWKIFLAVRTGYINICQNSLVCSFSCPATEG